MDVIIDIDSAQCRANRPRFDCASITHRRKSKEWRNEEVMNHLLMISLAISFSLSMSCKCKTQSSQESFCAAHWVSHVKVKLRISKQPMPPGSSRKGLNNLRYAVNHVKVYKKPSDIDVLPAEIYTPSEPPACGLIIDAGKEYLLAGRVNNGTLLTVLCGQVLGDNPAEELYENVLEWNKVPKQLLEKMETYKC